MQVTLNGKKIETGEMTILELARKNGIEIPALCYHSQFGPQSRCRMCVVEVDGKLVTSCDTRLKPGMNILTDSEKVSKHRKITVNLIEEKERRVKAEKSNEPLIWNPSKCILCGACENVCEHIQGVNAICESGRGVKTRITTPFCLSQSNSPCTFCGQCVYFCESSAISERDDTENVLKVLEDSEKHVIVQTAPSIRASLGELFGMEGELVTGKMASALRRLGFDRVFDTNFGADLTTYEETREFLERLEKGRLPHITSCCPAWIRFAEYYYPEILEKISTTKSPHMMLGSLAKTYYAQKNGINPKDIVVVSIMPCTAKKFEISRKETFMEGLPNVDFVLTTRELGELLKARKIDLNKMQEGEFDKPLGISSGGAAIYGVTGGVTENVLRSASYMLGKKLEKIEFECVRGFEGIKEAEIELAGKKISIAVASGLGNVRKLLDEMKNKRKYDVIEIMACPGGCIGGGGQPKSDDPEMVKKRAAALFNQDKKQEFRTADENPCLREIYGFLEAPLSRKAKSIIHTKFKKREIHLE